MNYPLVSVIITSYNGKKYLDKCIRSLYASTYKSIEIIFADDGSTDGSADFVRNTFPDVKLVVNKKNSGLAITSNRGAEIARGKYLLFYNNDTIALPDFIENMVKVTEGGDGNVAVCCPRQLPYREEDDSKALDSMGSGSDIYGYICLTESAGHIFYPDAAIFIKRSVFDEIGGFDPDFFLYGEDMDLCWRVHLAGYKIAPVPSARFRHDSFCSKKENGRFVTNIKRRSLVERQVINKLLKYYTWPTLLWLGPKFLLLYMSESLFFLIIKRNPEVFVKVYMGAVWWNIRRIIPTLKKRKDIQRKRRINDKEMMKLMYPKYRKLEVARLAGVPQIRK